MPRKLLSLLLLPAALAAQIDFGRDVRPILSNACFTCHGPDANKRKANLRLDIAAGDLQTKSKKRAVVPGDPAASEMLRRVRGVGKKMPPASANKTLSSEQIALLERWIAEGAVRTPHWAFVAPVRPTPPPSTWPVANPVDAFVHARLAAAGLAPAPAADRAALLRRVTLDLTGLPPTPERVAAFVSDPGADAYAQEVDRLLATPQHAEHMARSWLDAARYGDTHGLHLDNVRTMWPYRDQVVAAFASNQRFDQFTVEQLAGDLLPDPTVAQRIASGFNRCNPTTAEGGLIDAEYLAIYAKDRVATTATVWLGLTMGCATCHDHKYDPLTQKDFYRLYGFFNSLAEEASDKNANSAPPELALPTPAQAKELARLDCEIGALEQRIGAPDAELDTAQAAWEQAARERTARFWTTLRPTAAVSRGGATLAIGDDGVVTASGTNPERDEYELVLATEQQDLRAVRIRALVDPKSGGVGRGNPPNIVLTAVSAELAAAAEPMGTSPLRLARATADHAQRDFPAAAVLDADPNTGWALDGGLEAHELVLESTQPFGSAGGTLLRLTLRFESIFAQHQLARFQIAVSSAPEVLPSTFGPWRVAAPVQAATFAAAHAAQAPGDASAWQPRPEWQDGVAHALPATAKSATFLTRTITSPAERTLRLALGSDDALKVFYAGKLVHEVFAPRPVAPDQDLVTVPLHASANELLLQVTNDAGGHGFYFRVVGEDTAGLPQGIVEALGDQEPAARARVRSYYRSTYSPRVRAWEQELTAARSARAGIDRMVVRTMVSEERKERRPAHVLVRGAYDQPGEKVDRGVPAIFPQLQAKDPSRLDLARWLVSADNPLTARVAVNRLWAQLFGTGIVKTVEDFGYQGEWPSHRELLDWLACEFVASGWDLRHMLKLVVTSATYRQDSRGDAASWQRDPENRLLARGPRVRLDAETIRDQALFVAGLLVDQVGGPGVRPYQPGDLWKEVGYVGSNTMNFVQDHGEALWRRSLYTFWKRTAPPANLQLFDAPSREACIVRRSRTNTPLQALALLNDTQYVEAARALAARTLAVPSSDAGRLRSMWMRLLAREPGAREIGILAAALASARATFARDADAAADLITVGEAKPPATIPAPELAAWTVVAQMLLNLDETVTRR